MGSKAWPLAVLGAAMLAACASGGSSNRDRTDPIRALLSADALLYVSFDADGDLSTTTAEIDSGLTREFARADANSDGSLTPIEFQNWSNTALGGTQMGPYRLDFDRNVDNSITREEFDTELRARANDYDENQDAAVGRSEMVRLVGQARPPTPRVRPRVLE
jgi:hypothetical protein